MFDKHWALVSGESRFGQDSHLRLLVQKEGQKAYFENLFCHSVYENPLGCLTSHYDPLGTKTVGSNS